MAPVKDRNLLKPSRLSVREAASLETIARAFEAFKTANDERLKQIEARGASDVVTREKTDRIDAALTSLQLQLDEVAKRAQRAGAAAEENKGDPEAIAYRAEFANYFRRGAEIENGRLQKRAMSVADNSQGGYFASVEVDTEIARLARTSSPVREIANVRTANGIWKKRVSKSNNSSGWVGEQTSRPETNPTDFAEVTITSMELYAHVYATQNLLDDASVNIEAWIAEETNAEFAVREGAAFVSGNGVTQPSGLILPAAMRTLETDTTFAAHGRLGTLRSGSATALQAGETEAADRLINLQTQLRDQYQANARWLMNRFTLRAVRRLKDENSQYIWAPGVAAATPGVILGKPYTILDDMPSIADGAVPILYGDFNRYYTIVDRLGVRILRDPYSSKPYVLFYVTKRVGAGVVITEAAKGLVTAAD